ncbi:hypothetical protein RB195_022723 [Necator americanus]|uniref:Reverse transcriptase domain-containing protein n=1 Tax=Necator americanus TaxID=51031 RepID=A0ABR1EH07_NECAM
MVVKVDGWQLHHLRFANDIVLITSSISQAERMLTKFDETFGCFGVWLNLKKTTSMRNGWVSHVLSRSTERANPNAPAMLIWGTRREERPDPRAEQEKTSGLGSV